MPPFDISDVIFPGDDLVIGLPPGPQTLQFRHRTVSGVSNQKDNIEFPWYWTRLEHPALNNTPQAIATVTPVARLVINEQDHSATMIHNDHPVGLVYREGINRWYIYNLDLQSMEVGADFHVAIHQDVVEDGPALRQL